MGGQDIIMDLSQLAHEIEVLKNNNKNYIGGNTYNGVLLNVTGTGSVLQAGSYARFRPYRLNDGTLMMQFNIRNVFTGAVTNNHVYISGIVFARNQNVGVSSADYAISYGAVALGGGNTIRVDYFNGPGASPSVDQVLAGDVELTSCSWANV
jgi:hypothetical protein